MSLFDLSSVVVSLSNETATVNRATPNGYDALGRAVPKTWNEIASAIKISFQPISVDLFREPEAFTDSALWNVWISIQLQNTDRLVINGVTYEVEKAYPWNTAGNYCKAVVRELDPSEI